MNRSLSFPRGAVGRPVSEAFRALRRNGYFRRSRSAWEGVAGHKEWLHFAVHGEGLDLLANFSLVDDVRPHAKAGAELCRVVCLVREQRWTGDIDQYDRSEVHLRGGELGARFGHNRAELRSGVIELSLAMKRRSIALNLVLEPLALPTQANNLQVDDCPPIQWIVAPRLFASGVVQIDGRRFELSRAPAYHDHNWGYFRWGKNFAWEWGYAAPDSEQNPWTLVFVRLSDRAHLTDLMQAVFLWKGERQCRLFRAGELSVWHEGLLRPREVFKLPRVMGLASPENVTDVPARLVIRARRGADRVDVEFVSRDVAQVIIPNDDDLGVTIIHEVAGHVNVEGRIDGERVSIEGASIFEFLGHG